MTVSTAIAPFDLPQDGRCVCAECPSGMWCNYCIMKMEPRPNEFVLINRKRPSAPIFLSRDEALTVAQGLAEHEYNEARGGLREIMTFKPEPPEWVNASEIKDRVPLSEYLRSGIQAIRDCSGINLELLGMQFGQTASNAKFVPCIKDFVMGEDGAVMAWPEPDTHDEWRKLNDS